MNDRIEQLRRDAAELKVGKGAGRDGLYQAAGAVAMAAGVAVAFLAYQLSLGKDDSRDIQSLQILALSMLALAIAGAAVFVRYSLARFLRFWLLRQLYEGQAHIDQVVATIGAGRPEAAVPAGRGDAAGAEAAGPEGGGGATDPGSGRGSEAGSETGSENDEARTGDAASATDHQAGEHEADPVS